MKHKINVKKIPGQEINLEIQNILKTSRDPVTENLITTSPLAVSTKHCKAAWAVEDRIRVGKSHTLARFGFLMFIGLAAAPLASDKKRKMDI